MLIIGYGMVGLVAPRRHSLLWRFGPEGYRRPVEGSAGHPALVRAPAATEVSPGLWLTLRQYEGGQPYSWETTSWCSRSPRSSS